MNNYIFTQSGFYVDGQDTESVEERYEKLYHMGFEERPKEASASEIFLYEMVRAFFQELTSMPDLELLREHAQVRLSEASCSRTDFSSRRIMDDEENAQRLFGVL